MSNTLIKRGSLPGKHGLVFYLMSVFIAFLMATIIGEFALRIIGKTPGYIASYGLRPVDRIIVDEPQQFVADGEGVFKANLNYKWPDDIKINSEGFRSIEFKPNDNEQKKILFLGDSFTWGNGAEPITESFVDIISRHGYVTLNTGIPGTGPVQYAFLAEKYVPLLKPDIVIIMFCMRNDFDLPYPMLPYKNLWHITNAGWLYARDDNGNYISAHDAYEQHYARIYGEKNKLQKYFFKSVIGTYGYVMFLKVMHKLTAESNQEDMGNNYDFVRNALWRIKTVAEKNGAKMMLYIIPVKPELIRDNRFSIESNYHVLKDFNPFIPDMISKDDYIPNGHFNNSGNRKYAEFILKGINMKGNN
jgi:hypothetical protein